MLPSEINVPHDNNGLDPQEDEEVDRKDNGAGAEDHGWMVDDGFGEVNESQPSQQSGTCGLISNPRWDANSRTNPQSSSK